MATCETKILGGGDVSLTGEISGEFRPAGLTVGGLVTEVVIDDAMWYPLPPSPLANRNAISVQNQNLTATGLECKLNYSAAVVGYVGPIVYAQGERFYSITDNIILYAKAKTGQTFTLTIEELA